MNISCPRCGAPFSPLDGLSGICPKCAFAAVIETERPGPEGGADDLVHNLRGLSDIRQLGKGGMGVVYRARQVHLDRDVAVKVISSSLVSDPEFQARFQREAKVLASFEHPNIVTIHDFGIEGSLEYFVMEHVEGSSIRQEMNQTILEQDRSLRILMNVASAISYAHDKGVVHRDIKPENVLVRRDGRVKVVDFGIARLVGERPDGMQMTATGEVIGTPVYMAPEQRAGARTVGPLVDVYALGIMAYEMLTGKAPKGPVPPIPGVDPRIDAVIRRAIDPDPERRCPSVRVFERELRRVLEPEEEKESTQPPRISMQERFRRLKSSRLVWILAGCIVLELLYFGFNNSASQALDPESVLEEIVDSDRSDQAEIIAKIKKEGLQDQVTPHLLSAVKSGDRKKAQIALQLAYILGKGSEIPYDTQARLLLNWEASEAMVIFEVGSRLFHDPPLGLLVYTIQRSSPSLGHELFEGLSKGRYTKDTARAVAKGLSRMADPSLVKKMHTFLLREKDPARAEMVLYAFGGRIDIPVLRTRRRDSRLSQSLWDVYRSHLPGLLDQESGEAKWEVAKKLGKEIRETASQEGLSWFSICGWNYFKGSHEMEELAAGLDEKKAAKMEQAIGEARDKNESPSIYAQAVALRWRKTGRKTLPYYPYPDEYSDFLSIDEHRYRSPAQARAVLGIDATSASTGTRWEVHSLFLRTIAGVPEHAGMAAGRGNIKTDLSYEVSLGPDLMAPTIFIGVQPVTETKKRELFGKFLYQLSGNFNSTKEGQFRFVGDEKVSFQGPGFGTQGNSSVDEICSPGMGTIIDINLEGSRSGSLQYGHFSILITEPSSHLKPEMRWRYALTRALENLLEAKTPMEKWEQGGDLLPLVAWIPLPESGDTLQKLWEKRADFTLVDPIHLDASGPDMIGAALLMIGSEVPLEDSGLVKRLPKSLATRIYLLSPNGKVREAVKPFVEEPLTSLDGEAALKILEERGEGNSDFALQSREKIDQEKSEWLPNYLPYGIGALIVLIIGWALPIRRNRNASIAFGLIFTGLILRFLTLQVGDRLWIPMAGDLLFLAAAFLYGGWGLRSLAGMLAVSGILQMMIPGSAPVLFGSTLLFSLYAGALSTDLATRWLPGDLRLSEKVALFATWLALVVPFGLIGVISLAMSFSGKYFSFSLFTIHGGWAYLFLAVMIAGPLWLVRAQRVRLNENRA